MKLKVLLIYERDRQNKSLKLVGAGRPSLDKFNFNLKTILIMEKPVKFYQSIPAVGIATIVLLMIPLVAMQFTDEVNWSIIDFLIAGALLFGTGVLFVLVLRSTASVVFKCALGLAIGATFLMSWANLAVGLIGAGPNPGNLMYIGVIAILIIGVFASRFNAAGLERAMYATALALVTVTVIALLSGMQDYPQSSVIEILGVNLFFITPYVLSGLLFRYLQQKSQESSQPEA